jgi:hypothetical protein
MAPHKNLWVKDSFNAQHKEGLRCLFAVTGSPRRARPRRRAPSFHDLSVGEALAPDPEDRGNSGGGKFPYGSPGIEEKISQPSR